MLFIVFGVYYRYGWLVLWSSVPSLHFLSLSFLWYILWLLFYCFIPPLLFSFLLFSSLLFSSLLFSSLLFFSLLFSSLLFPSILFPSLLFPSLPFSSLLFSVVSALRLSLHGHKSSFFFSGRCPVIRSTSAIGHQFDWQLVLLVGTHQWLITDLGCHQSPGSSPGYTHQWCQWQVCRLLISPSTKSCSGLYF